MKTIGVSNDIGCCEKYLLPVGKIFGCPMSREGLPLLKGDAEKHPGWTKTISTFFPVTVLMSVRTGARAECVLIKHS